MAAHQNLAEIRFFTMQLEIRLFFISVLLSSQCKLTSTMVLAAPRSAAVDHGEGYHLRPLLQLHLHRLWRVIYMDRAIVSKKKNSNE
jgi:hypothetical protein